MFLYGTVANEGKILKVANPHADILFWSAIFYSLALLCFLLYGVTCCIFGVIEVPMGVGMWSEMLLASALIDC